MADRKELYSLKEIAFRAVLPQATASRYLESLPAPRSGNARYPACVVAELRSIHQSVTEEPGSRFAGLLRAEFAILDALGCVESILDLVSRTLTD
jgi:hypothetical protein